MRRRAHPPAQNHAQGLDRSPEGFSRRPSPDLRQPSLGIFAPNSTRLEPQLRAARNLHRPLDSEEAPSRPESRSIKPEGALIWASLVVGTFAKLINDDDDDDDNNNNFA